MFQNWQICLKGGVMNYQFDMSIGLIPHNNPMIKLMLNDNLIFEGILKTDQVFHISTELSVGQHHLTLEYTGKTNKVSDQAIEIDYIDFEGIKADRFVWAGEYTPDYPEPWVSEQRAAGIKLPIKRRNIKYLGWNGIWRLDFDMPIFTWIHQFENLGWIYN